MTTFWQGFACGLILAAIVLEFIVWFFRGQDQRRQELESAFFRSLNDQHGDVAYRNTDQHCSHCLKNKPDNIDPLL
jgi:hypothetical protein